MSESTRPTGGDKPDIVDVLIEVADTPTDYTLIPQYRRTLRKAAAEITRLREHRGGDAPSGEVMSTGLQRDGTGSRVWLSGLHRWTVAFNNEAWDEEAALDFSALVMDWLSDRAPEGASPVGDEQ